MFLYIFPLFTHRETETGGQATCLKSSSVTSTDPSPVSGSGPQDQPAWAPAAPRRASRLPRCVCLTTHNAGGLRWDSPVLPGCTSHLNILILMPEGISLLTFLFIRLGSLDAFMIKNKETGLFLFSFSIKTKCVSLSRNASVH